MSFQKHAFPLCARQRAILLITRTLVQACASAPLSRGRTLRLSRYANSGSQRAHARRRGAHPTRQSNAAMSAATRLDLLPSAAKGRPCGGSFPSGETCAKVPRRAHGGQRRMRFSMGVGHPHGAPWPCSSDVHHLLPTRAVQRGPADQKSFRQENDGARMGARDLRASQGKVVGRDYPILHRSIRSRVIAYERADERSRVKPHGRHPAHRANRWESIWQIAPRTYENK